MKNVLMGLIILLFSQYLEAQSLSNHRSKTFSIQHDTVQIDSLSVIPELFYAITPEGDTLAPSSYQLLFAEAKFIPSLGLKENYDSLKFSYSVFPLNLSQKFYRKTKNFNRIDPMTDPSKIRFTSSTPIAEGFRSGVKTSGNLSRGIQIGNQQDASLQSNLNLQITGKINNEFSIEAQLSDASIPLQPEGNTQQIQDFDRIFIRLFSEKTQILAGDFLLGPPSGHFLKMNKNLQGLQVQSNIQTSKSSTLHTQTTGAVVKGKYNLMKFNGVEGNQGPYRLIGKEGEQYIQIIAGSEKVYIDGRLLSRGEMEDYSINYNTAELTFSPKNLITKDKRIQIQFEYTERSYARFLVSSNNTWQHRGGQVYLNIFTEADAKNQSLIQELNPSQKGLLASIGDQLGQAKVDNYYETTFSSDRVMYALKDTTVAGIPHGKVLIYSVDPAQAKYQAGFVYVGENMGNYLPMNSLANGQVYKWFAPQDGLPQGSYEPSTKLIAPQSRQAMNIGLTQNLGNKMKFSSEIALSNTDLNTFSSLDKQDNLGLAFHSSLERIDYLKKDSVWQIRSFATVRLNDQNFNPIERYKPIEFERDWNIENTSAALGETFMQAGVGITGTDSLGLDYHFEYLNRGSFYSANKNQLSGSWAPGAFKLDGMINSMGSSDDRRKTQFLRHQLNIEREWKYLNIQFSERHEQNLWTSNGEDQAGLGSFKFQEWNMGLSNPKSSGLPWFINLMNRSDYLPDGTGLKLDSRAWESQTGLHFQSKKGSSSRLAFNWRNLSRSNTSQLAQGDQTATIQAEERFQWAKGALVSRTFYEVGSGLERKQEFYYLEVAPGQGYYTWTDYNGNGLKELDEFEQAQFQDQATYVRIFRPGNQYIPVFANRFTQTLQLRPGNLFQKNPARQKNWRQVSNVLSYTLNKKQRKSDLLESLNPFSSQDSLLVSQQSQFRNSLSFNQNQGLFGLDYLVLGSEQTILMNYGTDQRQSSSHGLLGRVHPWKPLWITNQFEKGIKSFSSSFFTTRNYALDYWQNKIDLRVDGTEKIRINGVWEWGQEKNTSGIERVIRHRLEIGVDFKTPKKGVLHLDLQFINLDYAGEANSPVGYVMLRGFLPGNNGMLNASLRRKLNEVIQLDLFYTARLSAGTAIIHSGNISVRAIF